MFMLLHIVTYTGAGLVFFNLQDYTAAFAELRFFAMYRSLDDMIIGLAIPTQLPRGLLLAVWMAPLVGHARTARYGWALIFLAILGLTGIATGGYFPLIATHLAEGGGFFEFLWFGLPEIFVQMLVFSVLLWLWERRRTI